MYIERIYIHVYNRTLSQYSGIIFKALFEVKYKYLEESIDPSISVNQARQKMADLIRARLFVVFSTNGKQPFDFYEYSAIENKYNFLGSLDYNQSNRSKEVNKFWRDSLKIGC